MTLPIAVVSHPQRTEMAAELAAEVGGFVVTDTECKGGVGDYIGCARTHVAALRAMETFSITDWVIVLEDDAIPVPDFRQHAAAALQHASTPLVGFYLGTGTNPDVQHAIKLAIRAADAIGATWIQADCLMSTVGYAVHRDTVHRMLNAIESTTRSEVPIRVTRWAQRSSVGVDYTWPSLVDHRDGWSTIAHRSVKGRRAHRHGTAARWDTGTIALGPVPGVWSTAG
jgi:GR25 family glycosyltransferase involved in LPS biosynthesis